MAIVLPCLTGRRRFATDVRSPRPRPTVLMTRIRTARVHRPDRRRPPLLRNTTVCRIDCCSQHPSLGQSPAASQPQSIATSQIRETGASLLRSLLQTPDTLYCRGPIGWAAAPGCTQFHGHPPNFPLFTGADCRISSMRRKSKHAQTADPRSPGPPNKPPQNMEHGGMGIGNWGKSRIIPLRRAQPDGRRRRDVTGTSSPTI